MTDFNREVLDFVQQALLSRSKLHPDRIPSIYWTDFARNFRYVRELGSDELLRIRYHTYHLTSDSYQTYYFADDAYRNMLANGYRFFVDGYGLVPLNEGEHGIGMETEYGRVSHDLLRYLGVMSDIKEAQLLDPARQKVVMELGGGYGGLARTHLTQSPATSYIICDLEETLFFSATYLANHLGTTHVHLVDDVIRNEHLQPGHIYIVPQSNMDLIDALRIDYAISQQSLQEMSLSQVRYYLEWFSLHAGYLYSCNINSHGSLAVEKKLVTDLAEVMIKAYGKPVWIGSPPSDGNRFGDNHLPRVVHQCLGV